MRYVRAVVTSLRRNVVLFPPEAEGLLRGAIGRAEEHRFFARLVRHLLPRRHDEHIARSPRERARSDPAASASLDDAVDRRIGGAIGLPRETLRQQLNEC